MNSSKINVSDGCDRLRTILVVDDDREAVIEIADALATSGVVFAGYVDPMRAVDRIERDPTVEGCFVDLLMPDMNGIEFIRRIRNLPGARGHIPLIAVSGASEARLLESAVDAGAMSVLRKPLSPAALREALDLLLSGSPPAGRTTPTHDPDQSSSSEELGHLQSLIADLELARRARTEFFGIVNHELRTPLNGVMGLAEILRDSAHRLDRNTIQEYASEIFKCGEALVTRIENILELSAERSSQPKEQLQTVPIETIIASSLREVEHHATTRQAEIQQPALMPRGVIRCRPHRIARAFALILENAIKFGASPPSVSLSVAYRDADWHVSIFDNGPGMSSEQMARAFEAFHVGDSSDTRRHGGLGIGLTLAQRYVREQGGDLHLNNRPEGGLRVDVRLPSDLPGQSRCIGSDETRIP